jgi:hypothetical protein
MLTRSYEVIAGDIISPERGLYNRVNLITGTNYSNVRGSGYSVAQAVVRLDDYRDTAIPSSFLNDLERGFFRVRDHGIKVVLRFSYNHGGLDGKSDADAPKDKILLHISQLKPLLQAHADVIAAMEAGFIGRWGEWHHSAHGLDNPTDRADIMAAILEALPENRMVMIRTPAKKIEVVGDENPLTEEEAYGTTKKARVAHHNDCFLASDADAGTYWDGGVHGVEYWKNWLEPDSRFTVLGGETCRVNPPRSDGPTAVIELRRFHWDMLHVWYNKDVLNRWRDQGYFDEIRRNLGYRLILETVKYGKTAMVGTTLPVEISFLNDGYSALFNERPVYLVLQSGDDRIDYPLTSEDPRLWHGGSRRTIVVSVPIPVNTALGTYRLALWLPDASPRLRDRSEYAVRFANKGVWDESRGYNLLASDIQLLPKAGGEPTAPSAPAGLRVWDQEH